MACASALVQSGCRSIGRQTVAPAQATPARLPQWRGFNLLEKFGGRNDRFREADFATIAEWGFDFVRLPLDYRAWTDASDWTRLRESSLREIDEAMDLGRQYGVHVQLNFHRAPGYTVAQPPETRSLWSDAEALEVCALHWREFARRYRGFPNQEVSFNLINEPAGVDARAYRRVVERLSEAIWEEDERRLVVCDGRDFGRTPPAELVGLRVAAATRGYEPFGLTHYRAPWIAGSLQWPEPSHARAARDVARLRKELIAPWQALARHGVGIMVGEFGAYNRTPHRVVLAWMEDMLALWQAARWGWALWNLRGPFGVLDSERTDVAYDDWRGQKLDRAMLALLQGYGATTAMP